MKKLLTDSKYQRSCDGARLYREARGVWHVQNPVRPNEASFTGTLREIERALGHKSVKMVN